MNHCYLLQTHRNPEQVLRLVRTLRQGSPNAKIVLCHDPAGCSLDREALAAAAPDIDILHPRSPPQRGEFSLIAGYLDALEDLLARGVQFDWLTYLSGQDYPLIAVSTYESRIERAPYDAYLRCADVLTPRESDKRRRSGHRRYFFNYRRLTPGWRPLLRIMRKFNGIQGLYHVQLTYGLHLGWRRFRTPFVAGARCYAGSQWHTLSRSCVEYLVRTRREQPQWERYFSRTICPDEAFVPTLMVNAAQFRICFDNMRFDDFTGSKTGSPLLLTSADLPRLSASGACFARKFDMAADAAVLDRLDARIRP